ncbi:MAG: DUF2130 domain-containing protein [Sphingobacteriales bacterium]|jgi:hypothetical protein|nr:DUF2130 domain-containing protein [Sphingobacteriales bacterium]NCT73952.1 DUF2130 domain-containing protein [Chitinophagaceae bacterium]OJW35547.1 MAG: hypothetical protein BGO54_04365 [Sphingobacteriales bacterium 46-32]
MATNIKCPNCNHEFPLEAAVSEEYKKELREQLVTYKKQKEQELARREQEWQQQMLQKDADLNKRLQQEKEQLQVELDQAIRKRISADFENKLQLLEQNNRENEERLKEARRKEAEFLRQQQDLKNKEAELELEVQKQLQLEREKLSEEIRKIEEQKVAVKETELMLRMKELEKQLEDQKRLADEMKRRAEQGSTQLQGEIQELVLEDMLRSTFPFDQVTEVGKGVRGADCIQTVRNAQGLECGRIIFESKRTKEFGGDWIEKLKADMRSQGADVAVLVTQVMPRDLDRFGEKNGVWICSFAEVKAVVHMLRDGIIKIAGALRSQENKGDKMHLLYNYLTSSEFAEQWKAIREGFMSMRLSIQKERDAMEKLWKAREKQLEKVLLNAAHIRGSIEGIAGMDAVDLNLLDDAPADPAIE